MEGGDTLLPLVAQFYGRPSQYIWEDDEGVCHTIPQGEGGEQGDPLMPALFSLGQHSSLVSVQETLQPTECLMAFLDDIFLVSQPERTAIAHRELGHQLWTRAGISLHAGKTQIWNKSGRCPPGCEGIFEAARVADPNAVVWKGDQTLPTDQQGVVVLGAPLGHAHFITRILQAKTEEHSVLFRRILAVQDLQCAWLLLLFCAATRANYFLRVVQPAWSERFAAAHDENVWNCIQELLDIEGTVRVRQWLSLPPALGGVGLAERRSVPDCRVLGQLGRFTPTNSRKASPHCGPCRGRPVSRQISRRQQSSGCSNLQGTTCGCWIRCPRVGGRCQRAETRQIPRE